MTRPSEQWIVNELRHATETMPLPPESRWVRERRSGPSRSTIAAVSVSALLTVAVVGAVLGFGVPPRAVPASGGDPFALREDAEWRLASSAMPSGLVVLRPTWVPVKFRGSDECPSPWASFETQVSPGYQVQYRSRRQSNGVCGWLSISGLAKTVSYAGLTDGLEDTGTVDVRGNVVHVRSGTPRAGIGSPTPLPRIQLWWNESGATYEVVSIDLEMADLLRVLRSLEPVR